MSPTVIDPAVELTNTAIGDTELIVHAVAVGCKDIGNHQERLRDGYIFKGCVALTAVIIFHIQFHGVRTAFFEDDAFLIFHAGTHQVFIVVVAP